MPPLYLREVARLSSGHFDIHYSYRVGAGVIGERRAEDVLSNPRRRAGFGLFR